MEMSKSECENIDPHELLRNQTQEGLTDSMEQAPNFLAANFNAHECEKVRIENSETVINTFKNLDSMGKLNREKQMNCLLQKFRETESSSEASRLTLIVGPSGIGKSTLAFSLKKYVEDKGGYYISGKFDQNHTMRIPYSPFAQAFTDFVSEVMGKEDDVIKSLKHRLRETIQSDSVFLHQLIPSLWQLVDIEGKVPNIFGLESQHRFHQVLRRFIQVISNPIAPLVLVLDDLQWCDEASLLLLSEIIVETKNAGFMIIATCRSNEVSYNHPLSCALRDLERKGTILDEITVPTLKRSEVRTYITNVLNLPDRDNNFLSDWIFDKTDGNILHVNQYLRFLIGSNLLVFENCWKFENSFLSMLPSCIDVVDLISPAIRNFDAELQRHLAVASCLGSEFHEQLLIKAVNTCNIVEEFIKAAIDYSLLSRNESTRIICFKHDKIQGVCYSLISKDDRSHFHFSLGKQLLRTCTAVEIDLNLFVVANQLCLGGELITVPKERLETARLCLRAGERAASLSAFQAASDYFQHGISFLNFRHWRDEYEISLALFNSQVEVEYVIGNFRKAFETAQIIIENSRSFQDSLRAFAVQVYVLGGENNVREAMSLGFHVLKRLGENFPSSPGIFHIMTQLMYTKVILRHHDTKSICDLKIMNSPNQLAAMRMLAILFAYTYSFNPEMLPLITFRMIQITLKFGLCAISSTAFAAYGMLLCCSFARIEEGYEYGRIALMLAEKFDAREWCARNFSGVYGMINTWKDSFENSLIPLQAAHRMGLSTGDIEFGMQSANLYHVLLFFSGQKPLPEVSREMQLLREDMIASKQFQILSNFVLIFQLVLNMQGLALDPLKLSGSVMNQDHLLEEARENRNHILLSAIHQYRTLLAFNTGAYMAALAAAKDRAAVSKPAVTPFGEGEQYFVECLTALSLAQDTHFKHRYLRLARKKVSEFQNVAKHGRPALINRLTFLNAEFAAAKGHTLDATSKFVKVAEHAKMEKNLSEEALAYFRVGLALTRASLFEEAKFYMEKALILYETWGATLRVHIVRDLLHDLVLKRP